MSGLDSIALAVAHLEKMVEKKAEPHSEEIAPASPSSAGPMKSSEPPPVARNSFHSNPRVVSSDSISDVYADAVEDENDTASRTPPQPIASNPAAEAASSSSSTQTKNNKNTLAFVLADPQAWLQRTEHLKIPEGPAGSTFDKIEENDVLCGRGGESNHHPGNQQYRKLVKAFQPLYIASKRRFKPKIAQCIVYTVRSLGGRFLKKTDPRGSHFEDVGNVKAREKTSQALREGAPELRGNMDSDGPEGVPINSPNNNEKVPVTTMPSQAQSMLAPVGALPANFMSQQFLQAQMGAAAYNNAFGPLLTSFSGFNPYQQALWMASQSQNGKGAAPGASLLGLSNAPPAAATTATATAATSGQKRSLNIVSSSSEENSSTSSFDSLPRGPRLKRLKQRLIQEHSDDESSSK